MKTKRQKKLLPVVQEKKLEPFRNVDILASVPERSVWLANFTSKQTRATYLKAVGEFGQVCGIQSTDDLKKIKQAHVIAFREYLEALGLAPSTIYNRLSAVSSLFKHLCEHQITQINPTIGVKRPKVHQGRVKTPVITPEQVRSMLEAPNTKKLAGLRDSVVLHILFYTGCRISEVCNLKCRDFHQDGGYWVLDFLVKGGKRNQIAIHPELQIAIEKYLEATGHQDNGKAPLLQAVQKKFITGKPLTRQRIHDIFHRYAKKAGLPKGVRPHTARATFITQALERKCPLEAVQRSVGHSNISTTRAYDKREVRHRESASFAVRY